MLEDLQLAHVTCAPFVKVYFQIFDNNIARRRSNYEYNNAYDQYEQYDQYELYRTMNE